MRDVPQGAAVLERLREEIATRPFERRAGVGRGIGLGTRHVGDGLEEDVNGALAAGITPILLRRDGGPGPPGLRTITTLLELP